MSSWQQAKEEELTAADMVRGIPEEVKNQLAEVEVRKTSILIMWISMRSWS